MSLESDQFEQRRPSEILSKDIILFLRAFVTALLIFLSHQPEAFGGVHLSLSGSAQDRHLTASTIKEYSASATIAIDIGQFLRLGYTYQRDEELQTGSIGFTNSTTGESGLENFTSNQTMVMQSIDLTLAPIASERVMPYIFGGIAHKEYEIWRRFEYYNLGRKNYDSDGFPTWNAGIGFAFGISANMQFKVSHSWSPGLVLDEAGELRDDVIDTNFRFGLTYRL